MTSGEPHTALSYYDQYLNLGGEKLSRGVWLELCRHMERQQQWHHAASEYERFAEKNASARAAVPALVSAAWLCMAKLNRMDEAERLFRIAGASLVPHLAQEKAIKEGLSQCAAGAQVKNPYARHPQRRCRPGAELGLRARGANRNRNQFLCFRGSEHVALAVKYRARLYDQARCVNLTGNDGLGVNLDLLASLNNSIEPACD